VVDELLPHLRRTQARISLAALKAGIGLALSIGYRLDVCQ